MAKRTRKPPIQPEVRRDWFERYTRYGETVRQISAKDKVDVRTVRKHIDMAQREIEIHEAKAAALRSAIEEHYRDLCAFAKKLELQFTSEVNILITLRQEPMWLALREHLPRSIIWRNFDKWEDLHLQAAHLRSALEKLLEKEIDSHLKSVTLPLSKGFDKRLMAALNPHIQEAAHGQSDRLPKFDMEKVPESTDQTVADLIKDILKKVEASKVYSDSSQNWSELQQVQQLLRNDLTTIILRRVVPGRCRYCPV